MAVVNKFDVNREQVTLDADIIENMSANDVSYDDSFQYDENTVGDKLSELENKIGEVFIESVNIGPASSLLTEIYLKKDIIYTIEAKGGKGNLNIDAYIDGLYSEAFVKIKNFNEGVEFTPVHSGFLRLYNNFGATVVPADIKVSVTNSMYQELLSNVEEGLSDAQNDIVRNSLKITENTDSIERIKYVDGSPVEAEINAVVDTPIVVEAQKQYRLTFISDDTLNIEVYVKNLYGLGHVNITKSGEAVNFTPADSGSLVIWNNGDGNINGNLLCGVEGSIAFDSKKNEYEIQSIERRLIGYRSFIKLNESAEVEKRAVPYSIGTPTKSIAWSGAYDRFNFIFFSDSHIDSPSSASEYSIENIKDVVDFANTTKMNISLLLNGGDYITPFGAHSKASQKEVAKPFFDALKKSRIPVMVAKGNHDTNDWYNFPSDAFLPQDYDEMFNGYMKSKFGTMHNTGGSYVGKNYVSPYFYKDFDEYKIRVIVLDNMDYPVGDDYVTQEVVSGYSAGRCLYDGGHTFGFRQEQMDWLINDALNFNSKTEKDWGVIICTHNIYRFYEHRFYQTKDVVGTSVVPDADGSCRKLLKVLSAFDAHATYSSNYQCAEPQFSLNINADFTSYASAEKKPYVICVLHGHEHIDANEVVEGINIIYIGNGSASNQSSDQRVARIPETHTQNLFDVVSVDQVSHKLFITRYGAGVNCYGDGGDRFKPNGLGFAYPKSMISVAPNAVVSSGIMLQAGKTYQISLITDEEFSAEVYIESQYSLGKVDVSTDSSVVEFKPTAPGNLVVWSKGNSTFNTIVMCKELELELEL